MAQRPYGYLWSDGSTDEDRTGLGAGPHTVTVTDGAGCTAKLCIVITEPTPLVCASSSSDVTCAGASDGSVSVTAGGGTAPYTYLWNTGNTNSSMSSLAAGTYTVTVTDANGCTTECSETVNAPAVLVIDSISSVDASTLGATDGSATAWVSGGTMPYSYTWTTAPVQNTQTATGLGAALYQVVVTDANGCQVTGYVTITDGGIPMRDAIADGWNVSLFPNPSQGEVTLTFTATEGERMNITGYGHGR